MSDRVEFTGERFLPECTGEIWVEHWHRYLFAAHFVDGKDVLDAACGEGYGSAWLAQRARSVTGLDIDEETVRRASEKYAKPNLRFEAGSVGAMPFADATFDCAVSFETLEHIADQQEMLAELRRVLRPDGLLIISTPNRPEYSDRRNFHNEFHVKELDEAEFHSLIGRHFPFQHWFGQKLVFNSGIWPLAGEIEGHPEWIAIEDAAPRMPVPMYFIALASAHAIPDAAPFTLLADPDESIYREYEQTVSRVSTLERLVREREMLVFERDAQLASRAGQIAHLEGLAAERERIVEERDRQLDAQSKRARLMEAVIAERDASLDVIAQRAARLDELLAERERIIVRRDAELAAANARIATAEQLISHRETVIVERDLLLAQTNERAAALEGLLSDRERIIVERDAQLVAANELRARVEAIVAARDSELTKVNNRVADMERLLLSLEAAQRELQREVARRAGLRWWLTLPYLRVRRALHLKSSASEQREA